MCIRDRCDNYAALAEEDRVEVLVEELRTPRPLLRAEALLSDDTRKEMGILTAAARAVRDLGQGAIARCIIAMTGAVSDILEPMVLLKEVGLSDVNVVPLFETIEDLAHGASILEDLWSLPFYREHLRARGDIQELSLIHISEPTRPAA